MTNPTIYIHIGYHKTGTTALQNFFLKNRKLLWEHDVLYPSVGLLGPGHSPLSLCLNTSHKSKIESLLINGSSNEGVDPYLYNKMIDADDLYSKLYSEIESSKKKKVIISSECFLEWFDPQLLQPYLEMGKYNYKIIVYIRRQDEWIESVYNQLCKDSFFRYCGDINNLPQHDLLEYFEIIEKWAALFGTENVIVRCYSKQKDEKALYKEFFNNIDVELAGGISTIERGERNMGLPSEFLPVVINFNKLKMDFHEHKKFIDMLLSTVEERQGCKSAHSKVLSKNEAMKLMGKYFQSNQKLKVKYLSRNSDETNFDEPISYKHDVGEKMKMQDIVKLFGTLWLNQLRTNTK